MSLQEAVKEFGALGPIVAAVLWFGRLEWRSKANAEDISKLEARMTKQRDDDRAEMQKLLAEIRQDIKTLLQRG